MQNKSINKRYNIIVCHHLISHLKNIHRISNIFTLLNTLVQKRESITPHPMIFIIHSLEQTYSYVYKTDIAQNKPIATPAKLATLNHHLFSYQSKGHDVFFLLAGVICSSFSHISTLPFAKSHLLMSSSTTSICCFSFFLTFH